LENSDNLNKDVLSEIRDLGKGEMESFYSKLNKDHKV